MASRDDMQSLYRRALLEARRRSFSLNRAAVAQLYAVFAETLAAIAEEEGRATMTPEKAESMRRQIEAAFRVLQRELTALTGNSVAGTARDVTTLHQAVNRELARRYVSPALARSVAARFDEVPFRAIQTMVARGPVAATFQTLIRRKIEALAPEVDTFLGAATARGVSAGRAAKDLARIMARDDPELLRLLDRAGITIGDLHRGAGRAVDYAAYGQSEADTKQLRGLLYDARRITVSETNNALREANAASGRASPIVIAFKWQLSGAHPEPDVCDVIAETDAFGYGPGYYPPDKWPVAPHPHCGCTAGAVLMRPPGEWNQPKPPSRPLDVDPYDSRHTARWSDRWSERSRERYQATFSAILTEANRFATLRVA